jgi:hypothetical protein
MLTQYKNIKENENAKSFSAERFDRIKLNLISYDPNSIYYVNENITSDINSKIELHVYSGETWLTGNHSVQTSVAPSEAIDKNTNKSFRLENPIGIDLYNELENLKLTAGNFRFVINFFKNLIGSFEQQHLQIDEISPDRTELRLRAIDPTDQKYLQQITSYIQNVRQTSASFYKSYLLNFSRNQCALFVNSVVNGEYLYVKLNEPLSDDFQVNFKCWIVEEQKAPYVDRVAITPKTLQKQFNRLGNPNWQATAKYNTSNETGLKTWTDLLGSSTQTSQQIVDTYFSGSLSGIKLNINYSDFNNFVFYSSATERLENFVYKLQLLEYYTSQSIVVSNISGSVATTNQTDFLNLKTNLIGGFDAFEQYLYYQSSSLITTHDIPIEIANVNVANVTGSYIKPVPKINSTYPYTLTATTSSQFKQWYDGVYSSASLYDQLNINALAYAIPEFIRLDPNNTQTVTFVNMLGHHFDILYTYINHMTQINKREENPKLGMPNELLYSVAKQFGWNLTDGNQSQELWQYLLGTDEFGTPLTGSNTVGDPSVPGQNMTYTIWRRIVNNLPYLLKTKGTKRSIQALLSCYGIPQSLISINEYGGPRIERPPVYEKLNFDYALDLIGNTSGLVTVNYSQSLGAVELRFRTDDIIDNPLIPNTMNLYTIGSNTVTIDFTSGTRGNVQINGVSSADFEIYNGEWISTLLRTNGSNLQLIAKKSKYGKIISTVTASVAAAFDLSGSLIIGGTSGGSRLVGQVQELRFWSSSLNNAPFENHVKAPAAYDSNADAYDELIFRLPLTQKINHSLTGSLPGIQPVESIISASFTGWTNSTPYDSIEETYYYDAISLGSGNDDNKIRIESNKLIGNLDVKTRAERSQYDQAPLDSKKLGVYFSPQTMIDEDIIAQFGYTVLDDYIGDPGQSDLKSYPELIQVAQTYWKKYSDRNNINDYIKMFTLFDLSFFKQLEQLLPARTSKLTGVLIQPNILERSKDTILPKISRYDSSYNVIITEVQPTASGDYLYYESSFNEKVLEISANDDDQWQMYLTASTADKYNGTPYSYEYLILSNGEYITGSTPYWISEAFSPTILSSTVSEFAQYKFYISSSTTASYKPAETSDFLPTGIDNQRYSGTKMNSPAFNVNSTQTYDGGPVAEWRTANPNQLIYQNLSERGSFRLT